jgi:hypothetical protein
MGCNSPAGPCGYVAPLGSAHKPSLTICGGNGDLGFAQPVGTAPYLLCTNANQSLSEEQLGFWGVDGTGAGATNLGGLAAAESPGAGTVERSTKPVQHVPLLQIAPARSGVKVVVT